MPVLPKQLVVIGDSSVYGWGDTEGGGWCERLRKDWSKIQNAPIIYQLGVRGDGIEKVSFRWEKEWSSRGETRRNKPKAILLSVGINDTPTIGQKNGRHQLEINGFEYGLERLIFEMKSHTQVFVIGLNPVNEKKMPFAGCLWYSNNFCHSYERRMEEVCINQNVPFLPTFREMYSDPRSENWISDDGIHLNSNGHLWIYQRIKSWEILKKWKDS
ncbi:Lysophospholipase L1 and related esterase [Prochlorococcus marinus str. MIT 9515]|uniref:Lysophospholipase L1 and related esterase n=1 Tax=Prochlorococcus marinus (strain MIT 9515) TaxID=167542 RepID=A2BVZ1_PROM5|nr:GDSL-type esterase/lipase family protein [Prochlorococcus marinus]ABM71952.1 Lysophospholipase L1 and related esterase [Prochlorococcus marinus str. MIT 9515]